MGKKRCYGNHDETIAKLSPLGFGNVHLERRNEHIVDLRIENEGKKNAFSGKMMVELWNAVDRLENSDEFSGTTSLFVRGTSDFFCSGADLQVLKGFSKNDGLRMSFLMQNALDRLRKLPQISIAVINGGAMGGGTELALSCDFRAFEFDSQFQMVHTKLGLIPGWGGGSRLVKLLGRRKAIQILSSGKKFTAQECLDIGLGDVVGKYGETAEQVAEQYMKPYSSEKVLYPRAVRQTKNLIGYVDDVQLMNECLDHEKELFSQVWQGKENLDALERVKSKYKTK